MSADPPSINRAGVEALIALAMEIEHNRSDRGILLLVDAVLVGISIMAESEDHAATLLGLAATVLTEARDAADKNAAKRRPC